MVEFKIIAALSDNNVIAKDNQIPWNIREDYEHYVSTVKDEIGICGRKTYQVSKKSRMRENIVLSNTGNFNSEPENVHHVKSVNEAVNVAYNLATEDEAVYILGGQRVYEDFLEISDKMILSHIDGEYEGDVFFPQFDESNWEVYNQERYEDFEIKFYESKIDP